MAHTFKCVLVGDGNVGKTTFIEKLLTGTCKNKYYPTFGVEVHPFRFDSTEGQIVFNVWDVAGQTLFVWS